MLIYGANEQAIAGDAIAAGDIHGDGCDDLFIGVLGDAGPLGPALFGRHRCDCWRSCSAR